MNRRQVLKSYAGLALSCTVAGENDWTRKWIKPPQENSEYFSMTVNGEAVVVNRAASSYSYINLNITKSTEVVITALQPGFWKDGVEILPSRHGIRPIVEGNSIRFTMRHADKLAISRPGDYYANAPLLFLFGNKSLPILSAKNKKTIRYYPAGVYYEDILVKSNETVYLDEGAIVYGSLNFWNCTNAHVTGRGVVIHDAKQNPDSDEGWQHRPNWHGITAHGANDISVKEITVLVRSRTWMIQLQGCKDVLFENIKVIGGTHGNANQDGIDWLGCGDTVVRNCFFRCSDDIFAIYGNTGFYDDTVSIPGLDVENILIEDCILSTSISNIMRVGWPRKVFNSRNISMRNCDVIHAGQGGCVVPFALAEFWSDPDGIGTHSDYVFDNIRMDNIYSLVQLLQSKNGSGTVKNIRFKNIRISTPPLVPSAITGTCKDIRFENIKFCDHTIESLTDLGIDNTIPSVTILKSVSPNADFTYDTGLLTAGKAVTFYARKSSVSKSIRGYAWKFGDGHTDEGAVVSHVYPDFNGTRLDGKGRFQVQLTITDQDGAQDVTVKPLVIGIAMDAASKADAKQNGIQYRQVPGVSAQWEEIRQMTTNGTAVTHSIKDLALSVTTPHTFWFHGYLEVPVSGGYTFYMTSRDGVYLQVNSHILIQNDSAQPQACNTIGNIVQQHIASSILEAGLHPISFGYKQNLGSEAFAFYWQGPANKLEQIPMRRFFF